MASTLGAIYGILILPVAGPLTYFGLNMAGVAWFLLSIGLLFLVPLSFHVFSTWGILWVVYRGTFFAKSGAWFDMVADLALPIASLVLLMTSDYVATARASRRD